MRVKRGSHRKNSRKKVLKLAKGYYGKKSNAYRVAQQAVDRALAFAYRDRRQKKRQFRSLWIVRINAAARENGLSYNRLISGLRLAEIELNRKVLADIAVHDPEGFAALVAVAKEAVADEVGAKVHEPVGAPAKRPAEVAAAAAEAKTKAPAEPKPKTKTKAEPKAKPAPKKKQEAAPAEQPATEPAQDEAAAEAPAATKEPAATEDTPKGELEAMTVPELETLAAAHGIEESDLAGSGASGNVVKADWVRAAQGVDHLTVPELETLATRRGIAEADVEGSGAGGNVVKADWVRALSGSQPE